MSRSFESCLCSCVLLHTCPCPLGLTTFCLFISFPLLRILSFPVLLKSSFSFWQETEELSLLLSVLRYLTLKSSQLSFVGRLDLFVRYFYTKFLTFVFRSEKSVFLRLSFVFRIMFPSRRPTSFTKVYLRPPLYTYPIYVSYK